MVWLQTPLLLVLSCSLWATPALAQTHCPARCSGHGTCGSNYQCTCQTGFTGHDCALRTCPTGFAWTGYPTATDVLHTQTVECSNVGSCDRASGECKCTAPFSGVACERMDCPKGTASEAFCSGQGQCMSMRDMAATQDDVRLMTTTTYTLWDADRIFGCVCDKGYGGYDCSLRECVNGHDPGVSGRVDEEQTFSCTASTAGVLQLKLFGEVTTVLPSTATRNEMKAALEALTYVDEVEVASGSTAICSSSGASFVITFVRQQGDIPLITLTQNTVDSASFSETQAGTKLSIQCSGRGLCNTDAGSTSTPGLCTCQTNFEASDGTGSLLTGNVGDCGFIDVSISGRTIVCPQVTVNSNQLTCYGNGYCPSSGTTTVCICNEGFTGYDCSLRTCPYGFAWADEASAANTAHAMAECSNRGICDRSAGTCTCQDGFTGAACERLKCPVVNSAPCNGRGLCLSNAELGQERRVNGVLTALTYGSVPGAAATWDADKIYGCYCDQGTYDYNQYSWTGHDCALRTCPRGDDPNTATATTGAHLDEIQSVKCDATGGTFTLAFRDETTVPISATTQAMGTLQTLDTGLTSATSSTVTFGSTTVTSGSDHSASLSASDQITLINVVTLDTRTYTVSGASGTSITTTEPVGMASGTSYSLSKVVTSVESALEALSTIRDVTVAMTVTGGTTTSTTACASGGVDIAITFLTEFGNLPDLALGASSLTGGASSLTLTNTQAGTKESAECSLHGTCDQTKGICKCDSGWSTSDGRGNSGTHGDCGFTENGF